MGSRSLLPWVEQLLHKGYNLQHEGVKKEVESLSREFESIEVALQEVAELPPNRLDEQDKLWASELRELSYDIAAVLDTFLVRAEVSPGPPGPTRGFGKTVVYWKNKRSTRNHIDDKIKELKKLANEVATRRARYRVDGVVAAPPATGVDPFLLALHTRATALVGFSKPKNEVLKKLKENAKVVSIVGVGGLGKTTLANQVYQSKQLDGFDCRAFVSVGRHPEITQLYGMMLREFDSHKYKRVNMSTWDVNQHVQELRQFLQYKRYFIVIDDIWSKSVWDDIRIALTDGNSNHGSRIITTTRNLDLARKLGDVYELQHLSDDNSKKLFYRRVVGGGHPDDQLVQVSGKLLKKCGGVPLAIITVASLLATKPRGDWPRLYDSLGFGQEDNRDMDNMRKILSFSYYDLPCSIRSCLLYLTVSRGYPIDKDNVILMWIAEGFVRKENGERLFETGERYFNQLVNRCLIQPLEAPLSRQITGCRVHDVVLDLIHHLSDEENFITVSQNEQYTSSQHKVHRLCINGRTVEDIPEVPQVRSFYLSHCAIQMMLPLSSFQVLRALHLDGCSFLESYDLKHLGSLVHLRHLGLLYTPIRELPKEIGDLRFLLSLIVRDTGIEELPTSLCQLGQLVNLIVTGNVRLPDEIGKLTSLEHLEFSCVGGCTILMEEVGKLTELRMLIIHLHESEESSEKALVESLCKLQKLQHLGVDCSPFRNDTWESLVPPPELRRLFFDAGMEFPKMPKWITSELFPNLCFLSLVVSDMEPDDIYIFNTLPQLTGLRLTAIRISGHLCYGVKLAASDYFKNLISFGFNSCMKFERDNHGVGSMQNLEILDMFVHVREEKRINPDFVFGLESLVSLASVIVKINCSQAKVWEVEEVEAALRREVEAHSNHPTLAMMRVGGDTMISTEENPESDDGINDDDDEVLKKMFGDIPIVDEKDRRWRIPFLQDYRRDQRKIMDIKCQSERGKAMLDAQKIFNRSLETLISEFNSFGGQRGLQIVFDSRCKGIGFSVWSAKLSNYDVVNRSSLWMWPMLEEVGVLLDCKEAKVWEVEEMEAAFKHLVGIHTNRPSLQLVRMNEDTMVASNQDNDERRLLPLSLKNRRVHGMQHHIAEMKSSEFPRTMLLKTCNAAREMVSLAAENEDITNDKEKADELCLVTQRVIKLQSEAGKLYFSQESKDVVFDKMNNISEELSHFMESYAHNPSLSHKEIDELQLIKFREQEQRFAALHREMVELQSSHEFDGYKVVKALSLYTSLGDTGFTWGYDIPYKGEGVFVRRAKDVNGEYGSFLWFWPKLEELGVVLDCAYAKVWEVEEAEAAYKHIVDIHASRPNLRVIRINEEKMISSDQDDVERMLLLLRLKYRRVHAMQRDMAEVMSLEFPSAGLLQMCNAVREMASLAAENEDIMHDQEEAEKLHLETQLIIELQRRAVELNFIEQPLDAMRSRTGIVMKDLEPFILSYMDKAILSQDEQEVQRLLQCHDQCDTLERRCTQDPLQVTHEVESLPTLQRKRWNMDTKVMALKYQDSDDDKDDDSRPKEIFANIPITGEEVLTWRTSMLKEHRRKHRKETEFKLESQRAEVVSNGLKFDGYNGEGLLLQYYRLINGIKEPWFPSRRTFVYDGRCMGFGVRVRRAEDDHRDHDLWMWPMLEEMGIILDCSDATACEVEEVEAVYRHAVDIHPNNPTLRLTKVNEDKMIASEQDEAVQRLLLMRLKARRIRTMRRYEAEALQEMVSSFKHIFEVILKMCIVALETVSLAAENVNDDQEKAEEELRLTTKRVREFQREAVKLYFCQESDMVVFPRAEYIVKELFQLRNGIADGPFLSRLEKELESTQCSEQPESVQQSGQKGVLLKMAGLTREALLLAAEYKDMLNDQTNGEEYLYLATQRVEELQREMEKLVTKLPMGSIHPVNATRQSAIFVMRPDVMSAGVGDIILELNFFWNAYTAKATFLSDDVLEESQLARRRDQGQRMVALKQEMGQVIKLLNS